MNIIKLLCKECNRTYTTYSDEDKSCVHCNSYNFVYLSMYPVNNLKV